MSPEHLSAVRICNEKGNSLTFSIYFQRKSLPCLVIRVLYILRASMLRSSKELLYWKIKKTERTVCYFWSRARHWCTGKNNESDEEVKSKERWRNTIRMKKICTMKKHSREHVVSSWHVELAMFLRHMQVRLERCFKISLIVIHMCRNTHDRNALHRRVLKSNCYGSQWAPKLALFLWSEKTNQSHQIRECEPFLLHHPAKSSRTYFPL